MKIRSLNATRAAIEEGIVAGGGVARLDREFATPGGSDPYQSPGPRDAKRETQMVTGDLNAALMEWVVQYRISDPARFLFELRQPSEALRYVSESVMREVVGPSTIMDLRRPKKLTNFDGS